MSRMKPGVAESRSTVCWFGFFHPLQICRQLAKELKADLGESLVVRDALLSARPAFRQLTAEHV
jgi:hypothetical protein